MKIFLSCLLLVLSSTLQADELPFPDSRQGIVDALPKPRRAVDVDSGCPPQVPACEAKGQQAKGLKAIVADNPDLPKAGALIQFDFDSAVIRGDSYALLGEYGRALQNELRDAVLVIAGHTDYLGSAAYNETLSQARAAAVKDFLHQVHQIDPARLRTTGFGETRPLRGNRRYQSDDDRAWNRRVEFIRVQ